MNQSDEALAPVEPPPVLVEEVAGAPRPARVTLGNLLIMAIAAAAVWLIVRLRWHRLDGPRADAGTAPERPRAFAPAIGFGLFVAAIILAQLGLYAGSIMFEIALPPPPGLRETALIGLSRYAGEAIIIAAFAYMIFTAKRPQPDRRAGFGTSILIGAGALLLFWPVTITLAWIINLIVERVRGTLPDPVAHQTLAALLEDERTIWFFLVTMIALLIAPIFEEILYRGVLQETLVRLDLPRWYAIAATSAIFAAMHIAAAPSPDALPAMLAALFVLSLGFGWVYEKTGRLAAPIVMHILFNAGNLTFAMWAT